MLSCSDNDATLVLMLFRDTDGRMLLDIFDENLHPLSVSSSASSSLSCELSFFLSASFCFSHLFGSISSLEIRSATRLWQTWPRAETDLPLCSDVVQCCSTDCWMCHCHPGECLRDDINHLTDPVLFSKLGLLWFNKSRCYRGFFFSPWRPRKFLDGKRYYSSFSWGD